MRYDFDMKPNQVVLYMDILGFKEAIKNIKKPKSDESKDDVQLNFQWLNELIHDEMNASKDCIKFLFVSDSLILSTGIENINQLLEKMFKLQHILICSDFVVRGAICIGDLYHEKNMCGEPYICAIELEENKCIYPRILISIDDFEKLNISEEYLKYFVDDFKMPIYKYIDPISYEIENIIKISKNNSQYDIWATLNRIISLIEQQCIDNKDNKRVLEKWKWLAGVFITVLQNNKSDISDLLNKSTTAKIRKGSFKQCLERLQKVYNEMQN